MQQTIICHGQIFKAHECSCGFKCTEAHDMEQHKLWHAIHDALGIAHHYGTPVYIVKGAREMRESYKVY